MNHRTPITPREWILLRGVASEQDSHLKRRAGSGFIEVVISVLLVVLLLVLILFLINRTRSSALTIRGQDNVRNLGEKVHIYLDTHQEFPSNRPLPKKAKEETEQKKIDRL